ncbi:MAG: alanine--glyoxylate aminotransferase family protein [Pseudomonadales bacterium]|nr:alanine--glyoxylate aminotransferase family protein [Pseudomonadales bacterium]MCP5184936.1 alanine--glyoxylate aminotransferase family protein [Pseudomonadales bacterium]
MPGLRPDVDPDGLLEYSVVFTDRSLNHMSQRFQQVMRDISSTMREIYGADHVAVVPGGGTYAMEAVARQFATDRKALVVRNGFFSFRWSQILDAGRIASAARVLMAQPVEARKFAPFAPASLADIQQAIHEERPAIVFAPHVETASGILLPEAYVRGIADATHAVGGLFVLDCIASGALWVDMRATGVDILISAPQKGWSGSPCAGLVMMNARAGDELARTSSTSFALDLRKWNDIMRAYEKGGHAYHATMPTDGLRTFRDACNETRHFGFERARQAQLELGSRVRNLLAQNGYVSVAAPGFEAPGVVVSYTDDSALAGKFLGAGVQVAAGVPLQCNEPDWFSTFRIGLFGLDKLADVGAAIDRLQAALPRPA